MSRRKRPSRKPSEDLQIEWLKHRQGYPSPDEREKILRLRQELSVELLTVMVAGGGPDRTQVQSMATKYGAEEVTRAISTFDEVMGQLPSIIDDEAKSYREYRYRFGRFGAGLKYYSNKEIDQLHESFMSSDETNIANGASELARLLLYGWRDWEDITPPAGPPRPDDYITPKPASYAAPVDQLLEWGDDLQRSHDFEDEVDFTLWKKHIPALTRMALDPGLLNGWPAEKASWAPWHAIHALGALEAWQSAASLAELADLENDWLSDHLPHIWAEMGVQAEPSLWMLLEDPSASEKKRGLAAEALQMMAEDSQAMEQKVIDGFDRILKSSKTFNPTVNAYVIHCLNEMEAVDEIWATIRQAFDEQRVDLDIITPEDLEEADWDPDEMEDEEQ